MLNITNCYKCLISLCNGTFHVREIVNKNKTKKKHLFYRRRTFEENLSFISKHNEQADQGHKSYWMGVNQFADMVCTLYIQLVFIIILLLYASFIIF